jgi:hypothetical protein
MAEAHTTYRELEMVAIPEDVRELGIKAGAMGTIATVYDDGRMLDVEVSREDGATIGFVDLKVAEDGSLSLVAYTPFESESQAYR